MSLVSLTGEVFSPDNFASSTFIPDFTSPTGPGSSVVIPDQDNQTTFSNADLSGTDSYTINSVDLSTATSYRLGTMVLTDAGPGGTIGVVDADIIASNAGQVLIGVQPYQNPPPVGGSYYSTYILLSNTNIDTPTFPIDLSFANVYQPPCFARGTMIATATGEVAVEAIAVGDEVITLSGHARKVIWTGHRHVDLRRHPSAELVRPVLIEAGAIGDNVPVRDLRVSPDHNLFIDGVLIPAKCLVNGTTVRQVDVASVTYHHIELDQHDIVFAEGLPSETYLDTGNRSSFAEAAVVAAYPDFSSAPDVNFFAWEARGCARLVVAGPEVDAARAAIAARAASILIAPDDVSLVA